MTYWPPSLNPRTMTAYGPWTIKEQVFQREGTRIYTTMDPRWAIKVGEGRYGMLELANLLRISTESPPPNMIETHPIPYHMYGRNQRCGWYALRMYDGHAEITDDWRKLGRNCLAFLRGLHHDHHLVHMDIKLENILVERAQCKYVVADYDLMTPPDMQLLKEYDSDRIWYYLMMGGEIDAPLHSYRLDLAALGYALARMSWPDENRPTFRSVCTKHREAGSSDPAELADTIALRDREMLGVHPIIHKYLEVVSHVQWWGTTPPAAAVYDALEALLTG